MLNLSFLVVLGIIIWITYKAYIWPYYISILRKIPGPPPGSLLYGHLKTIFKESSGELHLKWANKYGSVVKFHGILNKPAIMVTDVEIIQELCNQAYDFVKPTDMLADIKKICGDGLVFVEGETHKKQRKLMNPAFSHINIKEMVPVFVSVGSKLKGLIEDKIDKEGSKINLTPYLSETTLDVIGLVGFNYEFNSLTSRNELAETYKTLLTPIFGIPIIISILSNYIPFIRKIPLNINKQFNNSIEIIERASKNLIEEKEYEAKHNKLKGKDLLSLLINTNVSSPIEERSTTDELKYQIMTFLLAGHETLSMSIGWALYLLAQHPHEQDLLREELVKAFPDKSKINPTFEEINSLEYLNCVIKETLRLIPPVGAISRCAAKDMILGNHLIPKDTRIVIAIAALHRLPSIWGPTADDFDPKRWLNPSLIKDVTNYNYLPFSTGPRSCIGSKLAMNELKVLLNMLIRNFVFQPVEELQIKIKGGPMSKPDPYIELAVSKVES